MSRIGKSPIEIPKGVKLTQEKDRLKVEGPKGSLIFIIPSGIEHKATEGKLEFTRKDDSDYNRALHGTTRAVVANLVEGVTRGFSKSLQMVGVGYRAEVQGNKMTLQLGFSHPIVLIAPPEIKLDAPGGTKIIVSGIDKHLVGMVADKIRSFRPPEPYKGKGIRYENEWVRKKAGKTAV
ncbi:MAG: 50S ribosomal protein L6 [candidate division Zixibacteria bacterium]|nr:50S ribosomal protein L6 [candidate division Zixibacteria bacterium]